MRFGVETLSESDSTLGKSLLATSAPMNATFRAVIVVGSA
jgi:hypothetical protein